MMCRCRRGCRSDRRRTADGGRRAYGGRRPGPPAPPHLRSGPVDRAGVEQRRGVGIAAAEEIPGALHDFWEDVTAVADEDSVRPFYVDVAEALITASSLLGPSS